MKTITTKEIILESLLTTNRVIEAEIKKRTNELVLSETLNFWKSPRDYHEILGILNKFLNENSFRWVDLTLSFLRYTIRPAIFPHPKIMIFLFGKRNFILKNIKEISGRIVAGDRWMGKEAGISFHREFNFKDFI